MSEALLPKNASFVRRASSDGITKTLSCKIEGSGTEEAVLGSDDEFLNEELHPVVDKSRNPRSSGIRDRFQSNITPPYVSYSCRKEMQ
jgi:hypothetical protein